MPEPAYPAYVNRLLAEAEMQMAEPFGQAVTAAICFEVLALFPEHAAASELIYRAFCDPDLIRENRKAIGRVIDEWDDRGWQQRRRLARSFNYMSRWEPQREVDERGDLIQPKDVGAILEQAHTQLLQDYLLGQARGAEMAWALFQEAFSRSQDSQATLLWIAHHYAHLGYFAEAVDILEILLAEYPTLQDARRLWAEVCWWRDNQQRIPWAPTAVSGDGQRYKRIMTQLDPNFPTEEEAHMHPLDYFPPDTAELPPDFELPVTLSADVASLLEEVLGETAVSPPPDSPVDWSYLDALESMEIDIARFPAWAQYMLLDIEDPEQELTLKRFLLSYFANPDSEIEEEE